MKSLFDRRVYLKRLTDEEVTQLILEIKSGEDATLLIENYRGYVLSIAYSWASKQHSPDDLFSAGFYGLWRAIENIHNFSGGDFLAFIRPHIKGEIQNEITDSLFGPTSACNRKRKQCNLKQIHPKRVPLTRDIVCSNPEIDRLYMGELIDEITKTNREKQIIEHRLQGMTDCEIATKLGCSHTTVFLTRKTISERFKNEYC